MKKIEKYLLLFIFSLIFVACKEDDLGPTTILDKNVPQTAIDKWLIDNYTNVYNVEFQYKLKDLETDFDYNVTPTTPAKALAMAKILKYLWFETLDEVKGADFTKTYVPKTIQLVGSPLYKSTSYVTGYAEGGLKIVFTNINNLNPEKVEIEYLTDSYIKTAFHEFSHILHQNKNYPIEFANLTLTSYVEDQWSASANTLPIANQLGYVSRYARSSPDEDLVETIAIYVTRGQANWNAILVEADKVYEADRAKHPDLVAGKTRPSDIIKQKFDYAKSYLKTSWAIDIDELRSVFEARAAKLSELDLINI
jgi:substrate import-associated zinc metallohydrolase lipoprotein